jgi:flagellar biosynthesis/type III secretory pathway protein FliH
MTGLIKAANGAVDFNIHSFVSAKPAPKGKAIGTPTVHPLVAENEKLRSQIKSLEEQAATHESALAAAYDEGVSEGRIEREAEFEDDRAEALERLETGFSEANVVLAETLSRLDGIAALVACNVLEKMFGDLSTRQATVIDLVRHQFTKINHDMVVAVDVSRADFPNTAEAAGVAETLNIVPDRLRVIDALESGDCRIKLTLGELDIGLDRQWTSLRDALSALCEEEAGD